MKGRALNNSDANGNGRTNGNGNMTEVQDPGKLDFEKAAEVLKKVVRENKKWLKEMAEK